MRVEARVRVPASGEYLQVLRHVVASVAARAGCSIDVLADLRLAVDEAALRLLHDVGSTTALMAEATRVNGRLIVSVVAESPAPDVAWPSPGLESSMGWQILQGLVGDPRAMHTDEGPAITFNVATSDPGGSGG